MRSPPTMKFTGRPSHDVTIDRSGGATVRPRSAAAGQPGPGAYAISSELGSKSPSRGRTSFGLSKRDAVESVRCPCMHTHMVMCAPRPSVRHPLGLRGTQTRHWKPCPPVEARQTSCSPRHHGTQPQGTADVHSCVFAGIHVLAMRHADGLRQLPVALQLRLVRVTALPPQVRCTGSRLGPGHTPAWSPSADKRYPP